MRAEFAITQAEHQEACGVQKQFDPHQRAVRRAVGWIFGLVIAALFVMGLFQADDGAGAPLTVGERLTGMVCPMVPWLVVWAILMFAWKRGGAGWGRRGGGRRTGGRTGLLAILMAGALIAMGVLALALVSVRRPAAVVASPQGTAPAPLLSVLLPLVPWLVIFGVILLIFRWLRRSAVKHYWEGQPSVRRQRTLEVMETGLVFTDATALRQLSWAHFIRGVETEDLFVLFYGEFNIEIIPKRAFHRTEDIEGFRGLLRANVPQFIGHALPSGFPVIAGSA